MSEEHVDPQQNGRVRGRPFKKGNGGRRPGSKNRTTLVAEGLLKGEEEELVEIAPELTGHGLPLSSVRHTTVSMTNSTNRVEIITSVQRRRRWTAPEKVRMVEETFEPGMTVSLVARRHGVAPKPVVHLASAGTATAITNSTEPTIHNRKSQRRQFIVGSLLRTTALRRHHRHLVDSVSGSPNSCKNHCSIASIVNLKNIILCCCCFSSIEDSQPD